MLVATQTLTWNTVSKLCQNVSKLLRGLYSAASKLNFPPNTCIPNNANITMKRNSKSSNEAMDCIELSNEATKFESDLQYLLNINNKRIINNLALCTKRYGLIYHGKTASWFVCNFHYLVTLKTLRSRTQRNTDTPSGNIIFVRVKIVSVILPMTTKQSKRLKSETKYPWKRHHSVNVFIFFIRGLRPIISVLWTVRVIEMCSPVFRDCTFSTTFLKWKVWWKIRL